MAATIGNNCVKQLNLIRKDLDAFASTPTAALKGQITLSIQKLSEHIETYELVTKTEQNGAKHDKQVSKLREFRDQYHDLSTRFKSLSQSVEYSDNRTQLLHRSATPENPYANQSRVDGNLREASALGRIGTTLDEYIESGLASLGDIKDQNSTLKGTQKKLRDVAVGLGFSGDTIRNVERRIKGDRYVFYGGCLVTLICFYLILKYFG